VQKPLITDNSDLMKLTKHLVEKPWGRTDIPAQFGDMGDRRIGEIWYEIADGAPLPILVKWLFTSEKLSIQVHPNDVQARERGLPSGKEECWYIVDAEPGAVLGIGTKKALSADQLREAAISGEIEQLMDWKPVRAGDYFYIPAGTVHAIGAGITLVEVQQYADITYRLYDYGRLDNGKTRELHLDDGVAVSSARPYFHEASGSAAGSQCLVDGPHFRLWLLSDICDTTSLPDTGQLWLVPLFGTVTANAETAEVGDCLVINAGAPLALTPGTKVLVSAACN
jgi:mannose-6-phosphate isomerase